MTKKSTKDSQSLPPIRLGKVLDFMRLLWAVDHGLQATSKRMNSRLSVTGPQRLVLRMVGIMPKISAGKIAEMLHLHPSTLTGVLTRLEERHFITRIKDPEDQRRSLFKLTKQGEAIDKVSRGTVEAAVRRTLFTVSGRQILAAQTLLAVLADELEKES